jgi:oligoendopeptidase F
MGILVSNAGMKLSWINPEIIAIGKDKIMAFIDNDKELESYRYPYDRLFNNEAHTLSSDKEELLSYYSLFNSSPDKMYQSLTVTDHENEMVTLSDGREVKITSESLSGLLESEKNQEDRLLIMETGYNCYKRSKNTFANIYSALTQKHNAVAKARNYTDILESFLSYSKIPNEVYLNLVNTTKTNSDALKKYYALRKKVLKLDDYYTFDRFLPLVDYNKKYTYDEAREIVFEAMKSTPVEYQEKVKEVLQDGWVDVEIRDGKIGGAYSWGSYGSHPYILLNYDNTMNDVFTTAHEAGHSVHSLYAKENQPYSTHGYTIFVAEVASIFAEHVLLDYLLEKSDDDTEKVYLLQKAIDDMIGTFYRQTLFADFEYQANKLAENNQPITEPVLSNIMKELYMEYYGLDLDKEETKKLVWARIPHLFNSPFYVYQYATCYAISSKLFADFKTEGQAGFDKFVNLLKSGGNTYPFDQVLNVGVDLRQEDTIKAVTDRMAELVDQLENILQ